MFVTSLPKFAKAEKARAETPTRSNSRQDFAEISALRHGEEHVNQIMHACKGAAATAAAEKFPDISPLPPSRTPYPAHLGGDGICGADGAGVRQLNALGRPAPIPDSSTSPG